MEFDFLLFLISFAVSITVVYLISPPPKAVFKYPTPDNAGHIVYQGKDSQCYTYSADKVSCQR